MFLVLHALKTRQLGFLVVLKTQVEKSGIPNLQAVKGITEGRTGQNMTSVSKEPKNVSLDGEATEWRLWKPSGSRLNTTSVN